MPTVSTLKENCSRHQAAQSAIAIVEGMNGGKEKVGDKTVDHGRQTSQVAAVYESNVPVHQAR